MTRYRIADDVAWVSLEDLDVEGVPAAYATRVPDGAPTTLDGPACVVWLALEAGGTAEEVTAAAAAMWDIGPAEITDDVRALLAELVAAGLVSAD